MNKTNRTNTSGLCTPARSAEYHDVIAGMASDIARVSFLGRVQTTISCLGPRFEHNLLDLSRWTSIGRDISPPTLLPSSIAHMSRPERQGLLARQSEYSGCMTQAVPGSETNIPIFPRLENGGRQDRRLPPSARSRACASITVSSGLRLPGQSEQKEQTSSFGGGAACLGCGRMPLCTDSSPRRERGQKQSCWLPKHGV